MRSIRQPVATDGNRFGLVARLRALAILRLIATGCHHGLHKGSIFCNQSVIGAP
jgi:hypothetical protein